MEVLPHDKISPRITKLFSLTEYDLKFFKNKTNKKPNQKNSTHPTCRSGSLDNSYINAFKQDS